MKAEVLSVGTELLLGEILDTNAQYLSRELQSLGFDLYHRVTVGDNVERLRRAFESAIARADLVVSSGGLGPTSDDVTCEALARALGRDLVFSEEAWEMVKAQLDVRGRSPCDSDRKQALLVSGATFVPNRVGTAPGQVVTDGGKTVVLLPGPPREMIPMWEKDVRPVIQRNFPGLKPLFSKDLKLVGIPEALVQEAIGDLFQSPDPTVAPYVGLGGVRLRVATRDSDERQAHARIGQMVETIRSKLGKYIYGSDGDELESVVGELLVRKGLSLAVAESCTGGLVAHRITSVPGASRYFKMGLVAYGPRAKRECLGVKREDVERDDAVNPEVAVSMARGIRALAAADIGLSTTGFAGPSGGAPNAPVGTVYIGLAWPDGNYVEVQRYPGDRSTVISRGAQAALALLWRFLARGLEE
ncbi:MAG TPA: competence/damage-inducible protein A [Firmicutes bacterium]|nr:competence/damage-inducible protein A [Candidatus Fermentithermobacillaceae bacterium]